MKCIEIAHTEKHKINVEDQQKTDGPWSAAQ